MKRTDVDFSQHELLIEENKNNGMLNMTIHYLKKPNTITDSVKFINTNDVLAVTGDYGNWIFCREFVPSANGKASGGYWAEKLSIASTQNAYKFSEEVAKSEIDELLKEHELSDEEKEWLDELREEADQGEYAYIAKAMDRPYTFETELIPKGKEMDFWFKVVLDAFDEICE